MVNRYQIDNNQEMWALGMGCIVASFFTGQTHLPSLTPPFLSPPPSPPAYPPPSSLSLLTPLLPHLLPAYPPGGSFSRTALKAELGVKTPLANVYASLLVTIVLVRLTGLLHFVPYAFLGAVIDVAVLGLMDFHEMYKALWVAPIDFVVRVPIAIEGGRRDGRKER